MSRVLGRDDPSYRAVAAGGGFAVRSARQHLQASFGRRGVVIRSGTAFLGLSFSGYGYRDRLQAVGAAPPWARANKVVYRDPRVTEWYVNGPLGLEQGFTLAARPAGRHHGPLTLSLAVSGNVRGVLSRRADAVTFTRPGVSLGYRDLIASDARGRQLPARIELRDGGLLLRIDDRGASYPLRIDPFVQQAKLTASDGAAQEFFGQSVAVSGNTVVVGAYFATVNGHVMQGAAYVFVKPAGGWAGATEAAKLTASDGAPVDELGTSVAISGDTVVAGASNEPLSGNIGQGAAYVFVKPAGGWASETESAKLTASDGGANDGLGGSVAVDGDTVTASALNATVSGHIGQGAAYVFVKSAGGWVSETGATKLTASDGAANDGLGWSVAISGNTVVASAIFATVNGDFHQGAAYVFVQPAGGWVSETEAAKLTASDGAAGVEFGTSVAVDGNAVVVGDSDATVNGQGNQGAAYVFGFVRTTTTGVSCSPSTVVAGRATTCTATVTDTDTGAQTTPTGTVSFSSAPGPGGFTGSPCTLSGSGGSGSCSVTYTPTATASTPVRADTITATYAGDSTHAGSSGSTTVEVLSITLLNHGSFVIGDQSATVGSTVTFWGAQWSSVNSFSGGPAPSSFKGFAGNTPHNPPDCGDLWTSTPGSSSGPPAAVPQYMAVIASSSITKSGSTISGNAPTVVVVKTNPGYGPNPGHPGTGTVVGIVCP